MGGSCRGSGSRPCPNLNLNQHNNSSQPISTSTPTRSNIAMVHNQFQPQPQTQSHPLYLHLTLGLHQQLHLFTFSFYARRYKSKKIFEHAVEKCHLAQEPSLTALFNKGCLHCLRRSQLYRANLTETFTPFLPSYFSETAHSIFSHLLTWQTLLIK